MEREFIVLAIKSHWAGQHDDNEVVVSDVPSYAIIAASSSFAE